MRPDDLLLAELAVRRGWVSEEDSRACLEEADRLLAVGLDKGVDEVLVEKGRISGSQARELRSALGLAVTLPRIGDYALLRRVGIGGVALVFEARHVRLQQRVALKVLLPRLAQSPGITERFMREARLLASFSHPNLVHAIDAGRDGDHWYLAMELVEGENLLQRVLRLGPLGAAETLPIMEAVALALGALAEKGLVHRDVKPANILLEADGGVKLADFGLLAEVVAPSAPGAPGAEDVLAQSCGTPPYMAPEQIRGGAGSFRSDLYSLGATWHHALTGRPPFTAASTRAILRAHLTAPVPRLRTLRPDLPAVLEETLARWLAKRPEERPAGPREALEDLTRVRAAVGRRPWLARAVSRPRTAGLLAAALLAAALLAGIALLVVSRRGAEPGREVPAPPIAGAPPSGDAGARPQPEGESVPESPPPPAAPPPPVPPAGGAGAPTPSLPEVAVRPPAPDPPSAAETAAGRPEAGGASPQGSAEDVASDAAWIVTLPARALQLEPWRPGGIARLLARPELEGLRAAHERLAPLARGWGAPFVGIEPTDAPAPRIVWAYALREEAELLDLRLRPGAWRLTGAGLACVAKEGAELVAARVLLQAPCELRAEVSGPRGIAIGLGSTWLLEDGDGWKLGGREALAARPPGGAGGIAGRRRLRVRFEAGRVGWSADGREEAAAAETEPWGRPQLLIPAGGALEALRIEGRLDASWLAERLPAR